MLGLCLVEKKRNYDSNILYLLTSHHISIPIPIKVSPLKVTDVYDYGRFVVKMSALFFCCFTLVAFMYYVCVYVWAIWARGHWKLERNWMWFEASKPKWSHIYLAWSNHLILAWKSILIKFALFHSTFWSLLFCMPALRYTYIHIYIYTTSYICTDIYTFKNG